MPAHFWSDIMLPHGYWIPMLKHKLNLYIRSEFSRGFILWATRRETHTETDTVN